MSPLSLMCLIDACYSGRLTNTVALVGRYLGQLDYMDHLGSALIKAPALNRDTLMCLLAYSWYSPT